MRLGNPRIRIKVRGAELVRFFLYQRIFSLVNVPQKYGTLIFSCLSERKSAFVLIYRDLDTFSQKRGKCQLADFKIEPKNGLKKERLPIGNRPPYF